MKNYEEKEKKLKKVLEKLNTMSNTVIKMNNDINSLNLEKNQLLREKEESDKNYQNLSEQHEELKSELEKINKDVSNKFGKNNNLNKLKEKDSRRVTVMEQDVRERSTPQVDVLAAQNFSFWIFKTREEVLEYFKIAYANLASEGVIVMDMMGGRDCYDSDLVDKRTIVKGKKGFKYHWEQAYFNPVNSHCKFYIHFKFADGSKMKKAFQYDWRFWTIPEVRELLMEAGFKDTVVYWEEDTEDDEDATWSKVDEAPNDYSWLCYVVGIK